MLSGVDLSRQSYDPLLRLHVKRYLNGNLVTYTFDRAGQQTTVQDVTGITSYSYYRNGTRESVVYPSGKALTYSYSRAQQRIGMVDPDGGLTTWTYSPSYGITKIVAPGGVSATITRTGYQNYPVATLMRNGVTMTGSVMIGFTDPLEAIRTYSYAGTALAAYSPTYDPVYNKTVITELDNVTTFTYDPAKQLTGEVRSGSYPYSTTYLYDSMGNRIQKYDGTGITTNIYNTANQLLLSVPPTGAPTTSSYDSNGNLILQNTGGQLTTYTWDQENRLISVAVPSTGLTTYVYSDDGRRHETPHSPPLMKRIEQCESCILVSEIFSVLWLERPCDNTSCCFHLIHS